MGTADVSISKYIVACVQVFQKHGLKCKLHAAGTNIEGEYATISKALEECMVTVLEQGAPRLDVSVRWIVRKDKAVAIDDLVQSVQSQMQQQPDQGASEEHHYYLRHPVSPGK